MSDIETKINKNSTKRKMAVSRKRALGTEIVAVTTVPTRRRRLTSAVWDHFTRIQDEEGTWARCDHCKKRFTGGSRSGTTHLRKHAATCLAYKQEKRRISDVSHPILSITEKGNDALVTDDYLKKDVISKDEIVGFDHESGLYDLARMIILHEYPFSIVEQPGFRAYTKGLQPMVKFISSAAIKAHCMAIFESERQKLYEVMNMLQCKVSFSMDMGVYGDEARYLCLTCHFIDEDWKLQKKLLKYSEFSAPQRNEDIAEAINAILSEWNLDNKLYSLVLDNLAMTDVVVDEFFKVLSTKELVCHDVIFLRCYAFNLSLMVQDGFGSIVELVQKVRESVMYVNSSEEKQTLFQSMSESLQLTLVLDDPLRWQSTFVMLDIALKCKDSLLLMVEADGDFICCPSLMEWDNLKQVHECLKTFYDAAEVFCGPKLPTANIYFGIVCEIYLALKDWCVSSHQSIALMAAKMMEKFENYWSITYQVLAVSAVLDPQQKMKPVELYFPMIFGEDEAKQKIKDVEEVLTRLFNEYTINATRSMDSQGLLCYAENGPDNVNAGGEVVNVDGSPHAQWTSRLKRLDKFLQETSSSQSAKTELDMYLEELNYPVREGLGVDFDILAWWKLNAPKYPTLAQLARNILAIPISTVVSKGLSKAGGRVADLYRTSFHLKTSNELIYAQDWMRSELEGQSIDGTLETLSSVLAINLNDSKVYDGPGNFELQVKVENIF